MEIDLAQYIDHTLLRPSATWQDIRQICAEATDHGFYGICVNGSYTQFCRKELINSPVKLVIVIGFPLGAMTTETKVFEAKNAIDHGADEIDMVMHLGALLSSDDSYVVRDITRVKQTVGEKILKVIIESASLNRSALCRACELVIEAGADYVKTSTGFGTAGASLEAVRLIKQVVGNRLKIKASGGIKSRDMALKFIEAGASRIGTSAGLSLLKNE